MTDVNCLKFDDDDTIYDVEDDYARAGMNDIVNVYSAKNLFRQNVDIESTHGGYTVSKVANSGIRVAGTDSNQQVIPIMRNFTLKAGVQYRLNGCPAGGLAGGYSLEYNNGSGTGVVDTGDGAEFYTPSSQTSNVIWIAVNGTVDVTFYPQLALARFDKSYDEPVLTNDELGVQKVDWEDYASLGAVNFAKITATTQTVNGATFTVNPDFTIEQTNDVESTTTITLGVFTLPKGTYTVSDGIHGTTEIDPDEKYVVYVTIGNDWIARSDGRDSKLQTFTLNADTEVNLRMRVYAGYGDGNVYKPMIALPSYNGPYVPYAKSNRELTKNVDSIDSKILDMNNIAIGKETIIRFSNESGEWGIWADDKFDSTTTLQNVLTYLNTNRIKADKVIIYANSNHSAFNQSLPDTAASCVEIISAYGFPYGIWDRCYVRVTYYANEKIYHATVLSNTLQSWKEISMS